MRRRDREVTDKKQIEKFISEQEILRVGFYDEGDIYIVPVNYGYTLENDRYTFYFHGARAGRKYELAKACPTVGFEIDGDYRLIGGEEACDYTASFRSVIGSGTVRLVDSRDEKIMGLNALMKQTAKRSNWTYDEQMLEAVAIFRLDADKISCKAKL